ncbi:MAG TPA: DUF1707 domain-containing protein [Streptosporangiaceae bacterium]|nr:DUF1707 domain-containing protein [Streptosporangiaceae bacterium]
MMGEVAPRGPEDGMQPSQLRASHEDRDAVIEALRVAAGDGRLTAEELDERLETAFTARTYGELATLTADLPSTARPAATVAPVEAKDIVRIDCRSGNALRDGHWVVPKRMEVKVTSGNVRLDFTDAAVTHPVLEIDADVRSGNVIIITKPGVAVDADDVAIRSGNIKIAKPPWGAVPVTLKINVTGKVGSGNLIARHRRRSLWGWLTRKPMPYQLAAGAGQGLARR